MHWSNSPKCNRKHSNCYLLKQCKECFPYMPTLMSDGRPQGSLLYRSAVWFCSCEWQEKVLYSITAELWRVASRPFEWVRVPLQVISGVRVTHTHTAQSKWTVSWTISICSVFILSFMQCQDLFIMIYDMEHIHQNACGGYSYISQSILIQQVCTPVWPVMILFAGK